MLHLLVSTLALAIVGHAAAQDSIDSVSYLANVPAPTYTVAEYWRNFKQSPKHDEIVKTAPDTWEVLPKEYSSEHRNPCWTTADGRFRCIPYFQIIGVSKCGTTDMFARLKRHPELADGSKGPHFWDECPWPLRGACTAPPRGDFDGYTDLFEKGAVQMKHNPRMITGEASSNTYTGVFTYVRGLAALKNTTVTTAELIREAQPYQRLIVLVREPVSRYYSAFHYYGHKRSEGFKSPEKFHERAVQEIERWKDCVARSGTKTCIKRYDPQQLIKGMYSEFVEAWTSVWPKDQILFMRNEDYQARPREHLQAVMKFLGLRDLSDDEWIKVLGVERTNAQSAHYPRMLPQTRTMLQEFYAPYNAKLAELLDDKRYLWQDMPRRRRSSAGTQ